MKTPLVSIIVVDYKKKNPYLVECLDAIQKQTYKNFEVILVCDYKVDLSYPKLRQKSYGHYVGPAEKRDEGANMAKGEILAFIDDDAFPVSTWLEYLVPHFKNKNIAGVGGPGITPPGVSWQEEASGWASASPMGAAFYMYRFHSGKKQFVEDYPSMNLAVRKTDFDKVGGYDSNYWPGEDTKLCLDLTHNLGKKILYEPKATVFHHRRPIWKGHLRQNGNFGLHRGFFARILPETSLKPIYFLPSLLLLGLVFLVLTLPLSFPTRSGIYINNPIISYVQTLGLYFFVLYFLVLFLNSLWIFRASYTVIPDLSGPQGAEYPEVNLYKFNVKHPKNIIYSAFQALLSIPVIFITHLWYGARFIQGFLFTTRLAR